MEQMIGMFMSPLVSFKELLTEFEKILKSDRKPTNCLEIAASMNLEDMEEFEKTQNRCSLEQLDDKDDIRVIKYIPGFTEHNRRTKEITVKDALKLNTFNRLLEHKESSVKNPFRKTRHSFRAVKLTNGQNAAEVNGKMPSDLLIYVRVYRPARATHIGKSIEKPVFAEEFVCLGSNYLSELRDKISCVCKNRRFFEISNNPEEQLPKKETDPGFFFITDTFYNDMRNPANVDYSKVIREWSKTAKGLESLEFKTASMENTCFIDLTVSIGFPQLYQHHGNCEHLFVFSQAQLLTADKLTDLPPRAELPVLLSFNHLGNRVCNMCGTRSYIFIVEKSDRQLHDPSYLCRKCFYGFHYINGKKIGNFRAYRVADFGEEVEMEEDDLESKEKCDSPSS